MIFSDAETACIKRIAALYENGNREVQCADFEELASKTGLTAENADPILRMLKERGLIVDSPLSTMHQYKMFDITSRAVEAAREFERMEKEPKDIVDQVTKKMRRHWIPAAIILTYLFILSLVVLVNGAISIYKFFRP